MLKLNLFALFMGLVASSASYSSLRDFQSLSEGSIVIRFYQDIHRGKKAPDQYIIFDLNSGRYNKTKAIDMVSCGESCWQKSSVKVENQSAEINPINAMDIISLEESRENITSSYYLSKPKVRARNANNFDPDAGLSYKILIVKVCPDGRRKLLEIYDVDGHLAKTRSNQYSLVVQETYRLPHEIHSPMDKERYKQNIQQIIAQTKASLKAYFPGRNERVFRLNVN